VAGIMKTTNWITTVSVILIATIMGSIFYFEFFTDPTQPAPLIVNNLKALADGQISFNVTVNDYESSTVEGVVVDGERYSWSHGSKENSTILKGETKQWSIDVGTIEEDNEIQIVVEANGGSVSANTTVGAATPNGSTPKDSNYVYDFYGGVNLFSEGIHVLATSQDPRTLFGKYDVINEYWMMLLEHETTEATDQDFVSIILSRGDKPTGGYKIQIENFAWLESYPVKFLFQVNFTDPGEGVATTDALTNPLVLVPIGKLATGEYNIEVPIAQYVLNIDEKGNPYYTQILTFAPVIWEETLTINRCAQNFQEFSFEQWLSDPNQYNGQEITIDGYYFRGFEIIVLSEKLNYSGQAEGHLIPTGRMLWIEGDIPQEIFDSLYQQEMMGPTENYGQIRIKGNFEYGGEYGHLGQYDYQIIPSEVWLLSWTPTT
jgi:hypothetical protein